MNSLHAHTCRHEYILCHTRQTGSVPCIETVTGGKGYLTEASKDACIYLTNPK